MEALINSYGMNCYFSHVIFDDVSETFATSHSHNRIEMLLFLDGDAQYLIEDKQYHLEKYDLIFIRPNKLHHIRFNSHARYERFYLLFDRSLVNEAFPLVPENIEVYNIRSNPIILSCFEKLDYYVANFPQATYNALIVHLIQEIVWNLTILNPEKSRHHSASSPLIQKALEYIEEHLHRDMTVKQICRVLYINENYFIKAFKEHMLITPKQYILQKRLRYAHDLILQGTSPLIAATSCGFHNYSSFYRSYLKMFGLPPSKQAKCGEDGSAFAEFY